MCNYFKKIKILVFNNESYMCIFVFDLLFQLDIVSRLALDFESIEREREKPL